ncbi:MAG: mechanosensitive ion channel [Deltaproteobacteria bacterium]|nr:mechanosensitive ion channel [Deltaproteobacteria bacterium]
MNWLANTFAEADAAGTLYVLAIVLCAVLLTRSEQGGRRRRFVVPVVLLGLHLLLLPLAGYLRGRGLTSPGYAETHFPLVIFGTVAAVTAGCALLFVVVLPRLRVHPPRILQDIIIAAASVGAVLLVASRLGINLSGLLATSAVLTAVIGLALQDTLGNIVSGLALQTDDSIRLDDWIKVGDINGRVTEIRWRYTAIETRNWETVIFPNSMLVKGQVTILGRRQGQPRQWRRWVWFNVDYRFAPTDVIDAVTQALVDVPIKNVSTDPRPNCILMDFTESYGRYAARYWLTDLVHDDPTDSAVRTRIYFALQRAGLPLSIPAHAIFMTEQTRKRDDRKVRREQKRRRRMLSRIGLFSSLSAEEHETLADGLRFAPFAEGEIMTRQGAEAHWLYIIESGRAAVRLAVNDEIEREVASLGAGDFFGERSLLTGEPRSATVVASADVECWRLEKATFQALLNRRPEIADEVAVELTAREMDLERARENLSAEAAARHTAQVQRHLADRIRRFFRLDVDEQPRSES